MSGNQWFCFSAGQGTLFRRRAGTGIGGNEVRWRIPASVGSLRGRFNGSTDRAGHFPMSLRCTIPRGPPDPPDGGGGDGEFSWNRLGVPASFCGRMDSRSSFSASFVLEKGEQQPEQEQDQQQRAAADTGLSVVRSPRRPAGAAPGADHLHRVGAE